MNEWRKAREPTPRRVPRRAPSSVSPQARPPPDLLLGGKSTTEFAAKSWRVGIHSALRSLVHLIAHGSLGNPENELMVAAGCPGAAAADLASISPKMKCCHRPSPGSREYLPVVVLLFC